MIEEVLKKVGAKVDSTAPIEYGTQYRVSRGQEEAIINLYQGRKGTRIVVQKTSPLADELRALFGEKKAAAQAPAWEAWAGSDESGKGDYFGPLAVAAVAVTRAGAAELAALGVRDSKTMTDATAEALDRKIRAACPFVLVGWMPEEYNQRHEGMRNVNRLLGLAHAEAIAGVLAKAPGLEAAVTDQFGDESYVADALAARGVNLTLIQRPKADETDLAVSAASIVARAAFVRGLAKLEKAYGMPLPKGAGPDVIAAARAFIQKHGREALSGAAKIHFKTTASL
jgi:ribonuclease HIII